MEVRDGAGRRSRTLLHPFRGARSDADRLRAVLAAGLAMAPATGLDELLGGALEHALAFTGHQSGAALLLTPAGDRVLVRRVSGGAPGLERLVPGTVLRGPLLALHQQALSQHRDVQNPALRADASIVPGPTPAPAGPVAAPPAYYVAPLFAHEDRPLGTLLLYSAAYLQPMAPEDGDVLRTITAQVALAVERAQLHDQLERTRDELSTLYDAGQAISTRLEISEVLSGILEMAQRLTRADCCLLTGVMEGSEPALLAERGATPEWLAYRTTPSVRLTIASVLRDGALRPLGIPPVTGWCIGLTVRQQVIGTLEVYARTTQPRYDESHLLNGLATQAAIALENAKLYKTVRDKEAHLQDLVDRMIQGQEEDRRRVAYDIHDGLAQLMVSAHQHLQTFGMLHHRNDPKADQALERGLFMLQKSIEEVRKVIAGLRPSELDDFGLVAAIQLYVQSLREDLGWQVELIDEVGPERLPAPVEVTAYRIIQEALTNSRRHGDARRARLALKREDGWLYLTIQDWGRGFDVAKLEENAGDNEAGHHVGLHGMRERASLLGGTFEVESVPGEGTTVRASIPFSEGAALPTGIAGYWGNAEFASSGMRSGGVVGSWPARDGESDGESDGEHDGQSDGDALSGNAIVDASTAGDVRDAVSTEGP